MKLQSLIVIFIIIILPIILLLSFYISTGLKTIEYQSMYDVGLLDATHDAIYAFELNTANNKYSSNPETKRSILKSSVKMFEKSLCNTCNIPLYNTNEIEEYIPAIVFGMYDGFYMYAPSYNSKTGKYEHNLKNYVYYSETLKGIGKNSSDVVIRYSLDNYVTVSGDLGDGYKIKSGYLLTGWNEDENEYKEIEIIEETIDGKINKDGINYYKHGHEFTEWFNDNIGKKVDYLEIKNSNDPENEESAFVQHKRTVIKQKVESVLNSSITAYSERTRKYTYKMPKLTEQDWRKIYNNISMITFFQGRNIGLRRYNGYCVVNSTNSNEYVNPKLMYFIEGEDTKNNYYHDIRCEAIKSTTEKLTGYRIGKFSKQKLEIVKNIDGTTKTNADGKTVYNDNGTETTKPYKYNYNALSCYECVNGPLNTGETVYNYIWSDSVSDKIKTSYWTSLGRERYRNILDIDLGDVKVTFDENYEGGTTFTRNFVYQAEYGNLPTATRQGYTFKGWFKQENGGTEITAQTIVETQESHTLYAQWTQDKYILDINKIINDGDVIPTTSEGGDFDIYINGTKVNEGKIYDYYQEEYATYGTIYEVRNIETEEGYKYVGAEIWIGDQKIDVDENFHLRFTVTGNIGINLKFKQTNN